MTASTKSLDSDRELTLKQAVFVHHYLATGNASEAYRRAYDASGMQPKSVHVEASRLLDNPNVALSVAELQRGADVAAGLSLEYVLANLGQNAEDARADGHYAASNRALELLAKYLGLFNGRRE